MALSQGPDPSLWTILGGFAAAALVWFIYFIKKAVGRPAVDPITQLFMDGMKEDIERLEHAFENHSTETNKRIRDLELAMVKVDK